MNDKNFLALFILIVLAGSFLRLYDLELRPAHHDEGNHDFFTVALMNGNYKYDPVYHGPFLYHVTAATYSLLGRNLTTLRLPQVIFGIGLLLLLFPLRKYLGDEGTLVAAALLAVSPSFVYYSKFAIHDSFFAFFTLAMVLCGVKAIEAAICGTGEKARQDAMAWSIVFGFVTALLFAVKETAFITAAIFSSFILIAITLEGRANKEKIKQLLQRERLIHYAKLAVVIFIVFVVAYEIIYTSFFRIQSGGIPDSMIAAVSHWTTTTQTWVGHQKPYTYYINLMKDYDAPIVLLGIFGLFSAIWRGNLFKRFLAYWAIAITLIFFYIPYKTPWLIVHVILPYALLAGVFMQEIINGFKQQQALRLVSILMFAVLLCYSGYVCYDSNFVRPADNDNMLAYVQTTMDIPKMLQTIENVSLAKTGTKTGVDIYMATTEYWPLPFYLRDYKVNWVGKPPESGTNATIIIGYEPKIGELETAMDTTNYVKAKYVLRPGVTLVVYYKKDYYTGS